jgi:two-component system, cell cycle sensor histidine kinase and response regulator CckA
MVTQSHKVKDRSGPRLLVLAFVFLAAGIVVAGSLYYQNQKRHYRIEAEHERSTIADLKAGELAQWWTVIIVGITFFGAGASAGLILGRERTQFYKERSKAAEAIRESEARFRALFEQAIDGMLLADLETRRFILANRQIQKLLGYSEDELLQLTVSDIHPADDLPRIRDLFEKMARHETMTASSPVPMRRKDGTVFFADISATPIRLQQRDCLLGIFRDITERKQAEEVLRRNETQIHTILESTADGILAVDNQGKVVKANQQFADLWRIPQSLMEGGEDKALLDFVLNQLSDPDAFLKKVQALYKSDAVDWDTLAFKDGRVFERYSSPMIMGGAVIGRVWSFRDITERKRAEVALHESETELRAILESTADGILAVDNQGKVIKANQRFADLWGIPKSLMESGDSKALQDFALEQLSDPATFLKKEQSLYNTDAVDMDTFTFKDGRVFERCYFPMIMDGAVIGRVWSFRDITEQRRLQQKLLQSHKMEAIGQLTAGIAHEFNNLLTAILGYSNLVLARLPSDSPLRRDLEQLEKASNRAVALTRQLLTFGRRYPQELKPINLNVIVRDMQRMLQPLLGSTIRLTASLDPALGIAIADPAQMEQIIMNMAVNARDAMPQGGALTIATANVHLDKHMARRHPESAPGLYIRLTVSDTGIGMSDEVKAKLFDPFFTTKAVGQGTGLGLATCIGIIKQTGGFIDVDSAPGKGTTFQIFLPQADADAMAAVADGAAQPPANDSSHR